MSGIRMNSRNHSLCRRLPIMMWCHKTRYKMSEITTHEGMSTKTFKKMFQPRCTARFCLCAFRDLRIDLLVREQSIFSINPYLLVPIIQCV